MSTESTTGDGNELTSGAGPLLIEPPSVMIEGTEYRMHRMGWLDVLRLMRILGGGAANLRTELKDLDFTDPDKTVEAVTMLLIVGVPYADNHVVTFVSGLLYRLTPDGEEDQVIPAELRDPERFPITSFIPIAEAIGRHPDLKAFLAQLQELASNQVIQRLLRDRSTQSKDDTDGQPTKS